MTSSCKCQNLLSTIPRGFLGRALFVMNYPVLAVPIHWIVQWATQSQCCVHLHLDKRRHHRGRAPLPVFTHPLILHKFVIGSPGVCVVSPLTWQRGCYSTDAGVELVSCCQAAFLSLVPSRPNCSQVKAKECTTHSDF